MRKKKCAICFRGKCLDTNLNCKDNMLNKINYKKSIKSLFENIIDQNPEIEFDLYLHGWVSDLSYNNEILNDYKPKKYILEKQKDFINDFKNIDNYSDILRERYKHIHNKGTYNYDSLHFQNYFQSIFSYAYSISKAIELIDEDIDYDYILHLRYDVYINEKVNLSILNDEKIYTDNIGTSHSPLFYGDFIYFSTKKNAIFFKFFYNFLKNKIFNNDEYKLWVDEVIANKKTNEKGRYEHGIYSNQMIYAYFITKNSIPYKDVIPKINSFLTRE
jgi:hypothetical protein